LSHSQELWQNESHPSLAIADQVAGLFDRQLSSGMGEVHGIIISYSRRIALE